MRQKAPRALTTYISLIMLMLATLVTAVGLSGCVYGRDAYIIVAGSTSVQPYAEVLAEEFARKFPEKSAIDIQGGGSSAGITAVESGTADIGMSSRDMKEAEGHLWTTVIAKDGLAIIVNPGNPIADLSREQLRGIYAEEVTNWSELGGPDARIHIIAREEGSGTRVAFEDLVMGGYRITPRAIIQDSNGAVRQLVADDPHSIGFISLGLVEIGEKPVKAVKIDGVAATRENVLGSSYSLYRSFLFVTEREPEPGGQVSNFIEFVFSDDGRRILSEEGLITEDVRE